MTNADRSMGVLSGTGRGVGVWSNADKLSCLLDVAEAYSVGFAE